MRKIIITTCILLSAIFSNAQIETHHSTGLVLSKGLGNACDTLRIGYTYESDTLVITDWSRFKFIKIGDKVYQINSPTISELQPPVTLPFRWGGDTYTPFFGSTVPAIGNVIRNDTLKTFRN